MTKLKFRLMRVSKSKSILTSAGLTFAILQVSGATAAGPTPSSTKQVMAPAPTKQSTGRHLPDINLLQDLLKKQYKVAAQPQSSSNPFPRLVPRSNNAKALDFVDSKYEIYDVRPFEDKGFFRHQQLLLIAVSDIFLEARIKQGHKSSGLFAFDGNDLTYLNGTDSAANLSQVLRRENRALTDANPEAFANLFATSILRQNNDRIDVVQSAEDVQKFHRPNAAKFNKKMKEKGFERLYFTTVDNAELEKYKARISKPRISHQAKGGWKCSFTGVRGFLHTVRVPFALVNYEISVSPKFDITTKETVLSNKIIY